MSHSLFQAHTLSSCKTNLSTNGRLIQAALITLGLNDISLEIIILTRYTYQLSMALGFQSIILLIRQLRPNKSIHNSSTLLALILKANVSGQHHAVISNLFGLKGSTAIYQWYNNLRTSMAEIQLYQQTQNNYYDSQPQQTTSQSKCTHKNFLPLIYKY